jgi:NitT/TauT family transport system substrate-binding protein
MDALIAVPNRSGVAVLPTSTSNGADACLVTQAISDIEALKGHKVYGLKGTVSEYCFVRALEMNGFQEADFQFTNQDPAIAAQNMQQSAETHLAIMVWNPFVLQTLQDRKDVKVLFDSSLIPGEIVDMVVIGADSLGKPDSRKFVAAVAEAFYEVDKAMQDPKNGDDVLLALGKKFSNLGLEDMKTATTQTAFYKMPSDAKALFESEAFKSTMKTVTDFCTSHGLVGEDQVSIGFGSDSGEVKLRFDASYLP